jgi:ABC-type glycerol-3-phosphate transport system substrate-binding protein
MFFKKNHNKASIQVVLNFIISLLFLSLTGCNMFQSPSPTDQDNESAFPDTEITVYSSFQDQYFYTFYGNYILQNYPNIKFKLIRSTGNNAAEVADEIKLTNPDLIITSNKNFQELRNQGYLSDLTPMLNSDHLNRDDYYPEMINALNNDLGQLNGLSPLVNTFGIFYNQSLFDAEKVAYPTDQMTWYELLQLSKRFSDTESIGMEGFSSTGLLRAIVRTNGWKIVDEQRHEMIFNKSDWIETIKTVLDVSPNIQSGSGELFLQGKSAMYHGMLNIIPDLQKMQQFKWGIVTTPVDSKMRDINSEVYFTDIFSIPQNAFNKESAWKVLKTIMSEDAVSYLQRNNNTGAVSTLNKYMNQQYSGVDLSAIWKQKFDTRPYIGDRLSTAFIDKFDGIIESALTTDLENKITPEEIFNKVEEQSKGLYQEELANSKLNK